MNSIIAEIIDKSEPSLENIRTPLESVAIVMDGNRRWAKKHGLPVNLGHLKGVDSVTRAVNAAIKSGVKVLTLFGFSTENWKRTPDEVSEILELFKKYLVIKIPEMVQNGVRLSVIGNLKRLPKELQEVIHKTELETRHGTSIDLVLAFNYGGRDDICRAIKTIVKDCLDGVLDKNEIDENIISHYLDTSRWKDPDLLIRTSGESRISNFLLWQVSYSEIYFCDVLWPDFQEEHFLEAIASYHQRKRRMGGS